LIYPLAAHIVHYFINMQFQWKGIPVPFLKKTPRNTATQEIPALPSTEQNTPQMKYLKPNILLMDCRNDVTKLLKAKGFNVSEGSFGTPYSIPQNPTHFYPLTINGNLPLHYEESEIVIVELNVPPISNPSQEQKGQTVILKDSREPVFVNGLHGIIDPRPHFMIQLADVFGRILEHGGVFIIFADPKQECEYYEKSFHEMTEIPNLIINNWSFLSPLGSPKFEAQSSAGREIKLNSTLSEKISLFKKHLSQANYSCTLSVYWQNDPMDYVLAFNKYDDVVSCVMPFGQDGMVFIFPQIHDKPQFLVEFLSDYLPSLRPELFPHFEGSKWVQRPEYEIPSILKLDEEIGRVRAEALERVRSLETQIEQERRNKQFLHDLLTGTGKTLVDAVVTALSTLGFKDVVDMDAELEKSGSSGPKREDLQIRDRSPLLLVEAKGIQGIPKESSSLQIHKYIAPRMKDLGRTDVRGLAIVNHERNKPPFDRTLAPFSDDIVTNANNGDFGLLTTWNLYRLVRSYLKLGWTHDQVKSLFYQNGLVSPIPSHYEYLGEVEDYWKPVSAVGIRIKENELRQGDRIAFELLVEFEEQIVDSLQVDRNKVDVAQVGMLAGVLTEFKKDHLRKKTRVYRIRPE